MVPRLLFCILDLVKRESYGEDIVDTDMEKGSSDDYDYSDSFINDDDPPGRGSHVSSTDDDESTPFRIFFFMVSSYLLVIFYVCFVDINLNYKFIFRIANTLGVIL